MLTWEEALQQILDVEGVDISVTAFFENPNDYAYEKYPYDYPLDDEGDFTVDDLMQLRIMPYLMSARKIRK